MKNNNFYFLLTDSCKNTFSINDYLNKKNAILKNELYNLNFAKLEELYCLLEQTQKNSKLLISLQSIKEKIEQNTYDIKGLLFNHKESYSSINKYTELFLPGLKFDIKFELYKISNNFNNKILLSEKNKYSIILSNVNEESKNFLQKNFLYFFRPILLFTNLKASFNINYFNGKIDILFRNTYKSKIYMELNRIKDMEKAKKHFLSSGIYIDNLKLNEFAYIDWINTEKLFLGRKNKSNLKAIKNFDFEISVDFKKYLEIEVDTLYIENIKYEYDHYNIVKKFNINICCIVKNIKEDKRKKVFNVILENLFDLNYIILEIPKNNKIMNDLYINCIYIFVNLVIFIDENMNIKLTLDKNKTEKIFLYFLIDPEKYINKKLSDFLIQNKFSQLIELVSQNKLIRTMKNYFVNIDKIIYIYLYVNESNDIIKYEGLLQCSDGTSSAILRIKGNNILDLNKLKIDLNSNINSQKIDNKIRIYPLLTFLNFAEIRENKTLSGSLSAKSKQLNNIQIVIIGNPIMEYIKDLSIEDIYEDINMLKNSNDNLINFDIKLTKNEYCILNGSFSKNSSLITPIPIIQVNSFFAIDEYISLIEIKKNNNEKAI